MGRHGTSRRSVIDTTTPQLPLTYPNQTGEAPIAHTDRVAIADIMAANHPANHGQHVSSPHAPDGFDIESQRHLAAQLVSRIHAAYTGSLLRTLRCLSDPAIPTSQLTPLELEIVYCVAELVRLDIVQRIPEDCFITDVFPHIAAFETECKKIIEVRSIYIRAHALMNDIVRSMRADSDRA